MAFPTTAVLDTFTRADGAVGGSWSVLAGSFNIVSNTCAPQTASNAMVWAPTLFGPNFEVYMTLTTLPASGKIGVGLLRNGTFNGYISVIESLAGNDTLAIERLTGGAGMVIASSSTIALVNGDRIGYWLNGSTSQFWVYRLGAWSMVHSVSDATYTGQSDYQLLVTAPTGSGAFDDVGGGNEVVSGGLKKPTRFYMQQRQR
jgi:hypothetical protein